MDGLAAGVRHRKPLGGGPRRLKDVRGKPQSRKSQHRVLEPLSRPREKLG